MKDLIKYVDKDTFLYELLVYNKYKPISQLTDFWLGIFNISCLIHNKFLHFFDNEYKLNTNMCFISDNTIDYSTAFVKSSEYVLLQEALCQTKPQLITNCETTYTLSTSIIGMFMNLTDLEIKDLQKLRDKFIYTSAERKKYERNYNIRSNIFGTNITDYTTILGSKTEKNNGLLAWTIPVVSTNTKRKTEEYPTTGKPKEYFGKLIQNTEYIQQFQLSAAGFQCYNKWIQHHNKFRGYYGQILDNIAKTYILPLATFLACNDFRDSVYENDVKNAIEILEITLNEALKVFENELNINDISKYTKILEKIRNTLLISGTNGIQHRSLYLKVHHDIDNDTFRYIMTLLHEFELIEKLKVSHNSIIYRATETLKNLNIDQFLEKINIIS